MATIFGQMEDENKIAILAHVGVGKVSDGKSAGACMPKQNIINSNVGSYPSVTQDVVFDFHMLIVLLLQSADYHQIATAILNFVPLSWLRVRHSCTRRSSHQRAQNEMVTFRHTGMLYAQASAFHPNQTLMVISGWGSSPIASAARQSSSLALAGLPRRFAPRNDD